MPRNIKVNKDLKNPETPEVLAKSIIAIATAFENLMANKILYPHTIVALLKDMPGMATVSRGDIKLILENLKKLKSYYVR